MAPDLFVDTSAWFALADPEDPAHDKVARALRTAVQMGRRVVTTNLVVAETHALLLRRVGARTALAFVRHVGGSPNHIVRSTAALEVAAVRDWLERFDDQTFSFTDAVSFAIMAERSIKEALALDKHFRVAGFVTVP